MRATMRAWTRPRIVGVAIVLCLIASPVAGEVGTILDDPDPYGNPYILQTILDDLDPFGIVWQPYHVGNDSYHILNPQGYDNGDGYPSVAKSPVTREPLVAWARNSAEGYDVVLSRFTGGAWTTPEVLAGDSIDEMDPVLVINPSSGDVHLFYWEDGSTRRVMHRVAPADLSTWSPPVQVSAAGEDACRPSGVFHDGVLQVVYEVHDYGYQQTPRQVVLARLEGAAFVPEIVAVTTHAGNVRPEVHSQAGRIWIDWIDASDEMAWTRKDSQGQWEPLRYETFESVEQREFHVRGAIRMQAIQ